MTNRLKRTALITVLFAVFVVSSASANAPAPYTLDNGLTVILRPVPTANKVAFVVLFGLGVAHDPIGKSGMTHLLEHLYVTAAAGDTPARDVEQFKERYPAGWNAQTGFDFTVIAGIVEPPEFTDELKDVAARMAALRITEADIEREIPRVLKELRNMYGGFPWLAGLNHTRAKLHPIPEGGQYGGAPKHLQTITHTELQHFWRTYYKPNNAILCIAGKFDVPAARESILENFSEIPPGEPPPDPLPTPPPKTGDRHRITVKPLVKDAAPLAAIGYAPPALGSPYYPAFLIVVSRLFAQLQPAFQMPKVLPVYYAPLADPTTIAVQAEHSDETGIEATLHQLDQHLHKALTAKITSQDRQQVLNTLARVLGKVDVPSFMWHENLYGFAFIVARQYQLQVDTKTLTAALAGVTDADLQRVATRIFAPEKRITVVIELEDE